MAIAAAKEMPSYCWWISFGAQTPELQTIAIKVLSQVISASACKRNWSTFNFIHTKKRNKLKCQRVRNIVSVHCNLRLLDSIEDIKNKEDYIDWSSSSEELEEEP